MVQLKAEINARINIRGQREATGFFETVNRETWNKNRRIKFEIETLKTLKAWKL